MLAAIAGPELTARQREAVAQRGGNVLVEAVPGAGKTRVLVARCEALLAAGVPASAIVLLTFSRRAVGELRARLAPVLAQDRFPDIHTFHGFAARLLAQTGVAGRSRRLLSMPAERAVFAHAARAVNLPSFPAGSVASPRFGAVTAVRVAELRRATPDALARLTQTATPRIADLLALEAAQRGLHDRLGVATFDDLVARCAGQASVPGSRLAEALRRYTHVLVDEFQDTDPLQLALLGRFAAEIFAVGDPAQAIYGFRGAARDGLARAREALEMRRFVLDESFRCPPAVCDLARGVWPIAPPLRSRVEAAGSVEFRRAVAPRDEAALIAQAVQAALAGGLPAGELAILVRSVEPLAPLVERELRARGVRVARPGGQFVLDDLAVDAICAALEVLAEPTAAARWVALFGHPIFGIAPMELRLALDTVGSWSVDAAGERAARLATGGRVDAVRIAAAVQAAQRAWDAGDPVAAARCFATEADVLGFVVAGSERAAQRSSDCIARLLEALADVRDVALRLDEETSAARIFATFLAGADGWQLEAPSIDDEPGVRILTIHAAKGLEFRWVAVADAVDARLPQPWRPDGLLRTEEITLARACGVDLGVASEEQLNEERSLFYVAVTRSKQTVLVTWSETDVDGSPQRPSRFIPLDVRTRVARTPSFRAPLAYVDVPLPDIAPPTPARLPGVVSTSKIELWLTCRRRFYYDALLRIGSDERGFKPTLGTLVHRAIEEFHRTVRDFRSVPAGSRVAWAATLRALARTVISADPTFAGFGSPLETQAALRAADRLLERYAGELERSAAALAGGFEVVASEERVEYEVRGVRLRGRIDRIDRLADGRLVLVDVKTGKPKKGQTMASDFRKLRTAVIDGTLWRKAGTWGNPQLALYRRAQPGTGALAYLYLDTSPKFGEVTAAAQADRLDVAAETDSLAAVDEALALTFFGPWTAGAVMSLEPTHVARSCRHCEFTTVCPGFLEDDDG